MFFPKYVVIFLNSASAAAVLVFDLSLCTHTLTTRGNRERPESGIYFKSLKNTIFNEHPVDQPLFSIKVEISFAPAMVIGLMSRKGK